MEEEGSELSLGDGKILFGGENKGGCLLLVGKTARINVCRGWGGNFSFWVRSWFGWLLRTEHKKLQQPSC